MTVNCKEENFCLDFVLEFGLSTWLWIWNKTAIEIWRVHDQLAKNKSHVTRVCSSHGVTKIAHRWRRICPSCLQGEAVTMQLSCRFNKIQIPKLVSIHNTPMHLNCKWNPGRLWSFFWLFRARSRYVWPQKQLQAANPPSIVTVRKTAKRFACHQSGQHSFDAILSACLPNGWL